MSVIRNHENVESAEQTRVDGNVEAGQRLEVRIVSTFEERQMVVAIRAAVLLGEQSGRYSCHFDENDHCSTLLLVLVDGEPAGTLRLRWFAGFARVEKMILRREYRNYRVLNALVVKGLRLAQKKGYRTVAGLAFPEVVPFWKRKGGFTAGKPIDSVYGPMVPVWGEPKPHDDIQALSPDHAGDEAFERTLYQWEAVGV